MEVLPDLPNEGRTSPPPPPCPRTPSLLARPISPLQRTIELSDVLCLLLVRLLPLEHVLHEDRVFPTARNSAWHREDSHTPLGNTGMSERTEEGRVPSEAQFLQLRARGYGMLSP